MSRIIFKALNNSIMVPTTGTEKQFLILLVPIPDEERKLTENFFSHFFVVLQQHKEMHRM